MPPAEKYSKRIENANRRIIGQFHLPANKSASIKPNSIIRLICNFLMKLFKTKLAYSMILRMNICGVRSRAVLYNRSNDGNVKVLL